MRGRAALTTSLRLLVALGAALPLAGCPLLVHDDYHLGQRDADRGGAGGDAAVDHSSSGGAGADAGGAASGGAGGAGGGDAAGTGGAESTTCSDGIKNGSETGVD